MSIANLINKIKRKVSIDTSMIMYLCIIVGVGISSFGLGRLSINDQTTKASLMQGVINSKQSLSAEPIDLKLGSQDSSVKVKRYVASKNGKLYYSLDCSGAKRIKPENQIFFSTNEEAEKSGFSLSSNCK